MKRFVCLAVLCVFAVSCTSTTSRRSAKAPAKEKDIRVLLAEGPGAHVVGVSAGAEVKSPEGIRLVTVAGRGQIKITGTRPTINVESDHGVAAADGAVLIVPAKNSTITIAGRAYDGIVKATFGDKGLAVLNVLPLDTYLESVLPYEIGDPGPDGYDALKSQAVAARTYAWSKMLERRTTYFDVHASVLDQVYGGTKGKTRSASAAVRDTRGRVLDYKGDPVRAYYCAACGGHTSDIRIVWPEKAPADYLTGVPDRDAVKSRAFCADYKRFRWRHSFTGKELGDILRQTLPAELGVSPESIGALENLTVVERSHSGRVVELRIETSRDDFLVYGDRIRWVLMTDPARGRILPSVLFRIEPIMDRGLAFVSIVGGGNGHGVGMCQTGAIGMSKRGYNYEMILAHYYPGCTIVKRY